jgi:hypothetical protein
MLEHALTSNRLPSPTFQSLRQHMLSLSFEKFKPWDLARSRFKQTPATFLRQIES